MGYDTMQLFTEETRRLTNAARDSLGPFGDLVGRDREGFYLIGNDGKAPVKMGATEAEARTFISKEVIRRRVYCYVVGPREGAADPRPEIIAHIEATGDCVWHAVHVVCKTARCHCAPCSGLDAERARGAA